MHSKNTPLSKTNNFKVLKNRYNSQVASSLTNLKSFSISSRVSAEDKEMALIQKKAKSSLFLLLILFATYSCSGDTQNPETGNLLASDVITDLSTNDLGAVDSEISDMKVACAVGTKIGVAGSSNGETTQLGTNFNVRTPDNYDPTIGYPLIVVYAGAGADASLMEQGTQLTMPATQSGYIIAYADHVMPNNANKVVDAATIPSLISEKWCIDPLRVYLTGHSNGGSVTYVIALNKYSAIHPAAIAPSAAGISGTTLANTPCNDIPIPVMVLHSANDTLFPGYGAQATEWWVTCNSCNATGNTLPNGCVSYTGCNGNVEVQYCEGTSGHGYWPVNHNQAMIAFFDRFQYEG